MENGAPEISYVVRKLVVGTQLKREKTFFSCIYLKKVHTTVLTCMCIVNFTKRKSIN